MCCRDCSGAVPELPRVYYMRGGWKKILNIFGRTAKSAGKPAAIAFVDYEHWFISMQRMYGERPDIRAWRAEISKDYNVKDILFFGDFSNQSLRSDIPRIREVSSSIIETQNASAYHKKDHTDFIMLDHIYQRVMTYGDDTDVFIIFSGDGHFSSVASFLVNRCEKKVVVYGVRDCLSNQLANTASVAFEWPAEKPRYSRAQAERLGAERRAARAESIAYNAGSNVRSGDASNAADRVSNARLDRASARSDAASDAAESRMTGRNVDAEKVLDSERSDTVKKATATRSRRNAAAKNSSESESAEAQKPARQAAVEKAAADSAAAAQSSGKNGSNGSRSKKGGSEKSAGSDKTGGSEKNNPDKRSPAGNKPEKNGSEKSGSEKSSSEKNGSVRNSPENKPDKKGGSVKNGASAEGTVEKNTVSENSRSGKKQQGGRKGDEKASQSGADSAASDSSNGMKAGGRMSKKTSDGKTANEADTRNAESAERTNNSVKTNNSGKTNGSGRKTSGSDSSRNSAAAKADCPARGKADSSNTSGRTAASDGKNTSGAAKKSDVTKTSGGSKNSDRPDAGSGATPRGGRRTGAAELSRASGGTGAEARLEAELRRMGGSDDGFFTYYRDILKNIRFYEKNNTGKTNFRATYSGTVDSVCTYYHHDRSVISVALDRMAERGYITLGSGFTKGSKAVTVNWDKAKADGLSD